MPRKIPLILAFLVVVLLPSMAQAQPDEQPLIIRIPQDVRPNSLDPAQMTFSQEVDAFVNLFIPLVRTDPTNPQAIVPGLADSWEISADGRVYTFNLRQDVPWVYYDFNTGQITPLRLVTAEDAAYSIRRACSDWRNGYYVVDVIGPVIMGCEAALDGADPTVVGVEALDRFTLEVTLNIPGRYFLSMATLWTISPVPQEAIAEHGSAWTTAENLITNGPFVLARDEANRQIYLRNPYLPADLWGGGNVERVDLVIYSDVESYEALQNNRLERSNYTPIDQQSTEGRETVEFPSTFVVYLGLSNDRPPLDDVNVRRAFSAAMNRQIVIDELYGVGEPMYHFAPSVLLGGLPGTELGLGYDPDYALTQLAEAGYPNCEGLPPLELLMWNQAIADYAVEQLAALGCDTSTWDVRIGSHQDVIDPNRFLPPQERPHMWLGAWGADYADADNFMSILSCGVFNDFRRPCTDLDDRVALARLTPDADERIRLYRQIQEDFFGPAGEFPIIPLARPSELHTLQPWMSGPVATNGVVAGERYDVYSIDPNAQQGLEYVPILGDASAQQDAPPLPDAVLTADPARIHTLSPPPPPVPSNDAQAAESAPPPTENEALAQDEAPAEDLDCAIWYLSDTPVIIRDGSDLGETAIGLLAAEVDYAVVARSGGVNEDDGFFWWQLAQGGWVRDDVVVTRGRQCTDVPWVDPS